MSSEITIRTTKATLLSWEAILALKVDLLLPEVTPVLTIPRLWEVTPTRWTQQSTLSCGDSSSVKGRPSTQDGSTHSRGDSSFIGGHPSTQDGHPRGDSSFVGGHPSTQAEHSTGDSSFVGGRPSTQEGDGQSNQTCHSAPGVPTDAAGQTAFNSSIDNH
jgi:hypothetical protein